MSETRVYQGDIVVRRNGNRYVVGMAKGGIFQLFILDSFNRYSDEGIEYMTEPFGKAYITLEQINRKHFGFDAVRVIKKCEYSIQENKPEPEVEFGTISEVEIERVISHSLHKYSHIDHPGKLVEKLAASIFDFLIEKEVIEQKQ